MQSEEIWAREFDLNWRTIKCALERADPPAYGPRQRLFALNDGRDDRGRSRDSPRLSAVCRRGPS